MNCYHAMLYWGICKELIWSLLFIFIFLGGKTPDPSSLKNVRTYKDIMQEQDLHRDQVCYGLKIKNHHIKIEVSKPFNPSSSVYPYQYTLISDLSFMYFKLF